MKEIFIQTEGKGLLDIKGDVDSAVFFHKKQPRVVAWEMDYNTLLDYFAGDLPDKQLFYLEQYDQLIDILEQGNLPSEGLIGRLHPFLRLLPNATYEIALVEYFHQHFIVRAGLDKDTYYKNGKESKTVTYHYYAGCEPFYLYATQRYLNRNRVAYYETLISQGKSPLPIMLTIQEGVIKFVVDGHHKTQGYINQDKPIKAIQISKVDNIFIDPEQFKQITKGFSQQSELLESLEYLMKK